MRVYIARVFLPFFIVFVAAWPGRVMAWTLQDLALLAPYVVTGGSVVAGASVAAASVAGMGLAVGMTVGYYAVCPIVDTYASVMGTDQPCVDVPSSTAAGSATPVPVALATVSPTSSADTWTSGSWSPGMLSSCAGSNYVDPSSVVHFTTPDAANAGDSCVQQYLYGGTYTPCALGGADPTYYANWSANGGACTIGSSTGVAISRTAGTLSCPSGYTLSGSTCNLSDPYAVASNSNYKRHEVTRSGTILTVNLVPGSPSPMHEKVMTVVNSNDTISISGKEANGNLANTTSTANSDGGSTITYTSGDSTAATQSTAITDSSGKVTATTTVICASGMVFSATDGSVSAANCGTSTNTNSGSGVLVTNTVSGDLPKALNTSAMSSVTAQANNMVDNIASAVGAINSLGTADQTGVYGGEGTGGTSKIGANTGSSWDWWLPDLGATVSCSSVIGDLSLNGGAHHLNFGTFVCPYVDNIRGFIDWTLNIGTTIYVFNLMFFKET